ncbi:MAG: pentapeptide repeat-containing protein [Arenicellales bacterium]
MKQTYRGKTYTVLLTLLCCYVATANAWIEDVTKLKDVNTLCKLEPEAQCTSAVRIGLNAPGVDMHNSSMTTMRLDNANLERANLSNSILQLSSLKGANLRFANLEGAHMHGVNLVKANLMMANLSKANLMDANLSGANLLGANLSGATLLKAKFDSATWTDGRVCAVGSIGECR